MSEAASKSDARTPEQIKADLARTRAEMTATVDELTSRLDPRTQLKTAVASTKTKTQELIADLKRGDKKAIAIVGSAAGVLALGVIAAIRSATH